VRGEGYQLHEQTGEQLWCISGWRELFSARPILLDGDRVAVDKLQLRERAGTGKAAVARYPLGLPAAEQPIRPRPDLDDHLAAVVQP